MSDPRLIAVIPAAGRSQRYLDAASPSRGAIGGGGKLAEMIHGRTVLAWSVRAFLRRADVAEVVIPTSDVETAQALLGELAGDKRLLLTPGGENRAASVLAGLRAARTPTSLAAWVAVHDAARPAVSDALISSVWTAARDSHPEGAGAAGPAMPVSLTIRRAEGPLPARAGPTLPRAGLFAMQTPQVARRDTLLAALSSCPLPLDQVTDDLQALELSGVGAVLVAGEALNVKVTVPEDLAFLSQHWRPREDGDQHTSGPG